MAHLRQLFDRYLRAGDAHFSSIPERKLNRVLNILYALNLTGTVLLNLALMVIFAWLRDHEGERYFSYVPVLVLPAAVHLVITIFTLWLKNRTGSFSPTLLGNLSYTGYMVALCLYFGERAGVHLVLLMVMPTTFLVLRYGSWGTMLAHAAIMVAGLVAALVGYATLQPLLPLPPEITRLGGYLSFLAAVGMLYVYSIHNWREGHAVEQQLIHERDLNHTLLQETIPKLEKAEAKYRHLVDDSDDLIFLADAQLKILSMNRSSQKMLAFLPGDMIGRDLCDFIGDGENSDKELSRSIVREQARNLLGSGKLTRFRTRFRHKHREDGVEVLLSLQLSRVNGQDEIIARAIEVEPEVTLRFLNREHGRGLTMARNAFDSVEFNAKGNQVTLTKRHSISGAKAG